MAECIWRVCSTTLSRPSPHVTQCGNVFANVEAYVRRPNARWLERGGMPDVGPPSRRELRGMKWCPAPDCVEAHARLVDRDVNAARNTRARAVALARGDPPPAHLRYGKHRDGPQSRAFYL